MLPPAHPGLPPTHSWAAITAAPLGAVAEIGLMAGGMAPGGVPAEHALRAGTAARHPGA